VSEEFRPIEVVDVGRGDPTPPRPPRDHSVVLLTLIAAGVLIGAACAAFTAWTVYETQEDQRVLYCTSLFLNNGQGDHQDYDEMTDGQQRIVDQLDCDVPGH